MGRGPRDIPLGAVIRCFGVLWEESRAFKLCDGAIKEFEAEKESVFT